jgi:1-acyl-sn-glycerol-3-phosphate acyltransferase
MRVVRSLLFALFFYPVTVAAVLIAFPTALVSRRAMIALARAWSRYFGWCAAVMLGIRARVEGSIPKQPMLVAAKHQSMFETLELMVLLDAPAAVVKRELAEIPFWGWAARRYGVIPVDRAGGAPALRQMTRQARAAVEQGRPILIFPEGTRVAPGEQPPLQPGFAGLYRALGLPVVPVALDTGKFWLRRFFAKRPGTATFRFGEPIPPGLGRAEIEQLVHAAINVLEEER